MNAMAFCSENAMETESNQIARGLRSRDADLLDRLIEQYQHRLLRYLVYLTGNRELAKDLFQETWIRVMERGHKYNSRHTFSARNLTIDHFRKKSPVSLDGLLENEQRAPPIEPADSRPTAWELVSQGEQSASIAEALIYIPAQYREAVVLRFLDELSLEELATVTGAPLSTVKSRIYRGLDLLMWPVEEETSMNRSVHDQARELIALAVVKDSSERRQNWLQTHLAECAACREYAEAAGQVARALHYQPLPPISRWSGPHRCGCGRERWTCGNKRSGAGWSVCLVYLWASQRSSRLPYSGKAFIG